MAGKSVRVTGLGPSSLSVEEALNAVIRVHSRTFSPSENLDLESVKRVILHEGRYVAKTAVCWDIRSRNTGKYKFTNLVFASMRRTKKRGWEYETSRSFTIGGESGSNSIQQLLAFLISYPQIKKPGDLFVVDADQFDPNDFKRLLARVSDAKDSYELLSSVVSWINDDQQAFDSLVQISSDERVRSTSLAAAINYGRYRRELQELTALMESDAKEPEYQK